MLPECSARLKKMSTSVPIEYGDLESALQRSSSGIPVENQGQICRRTGRVYLKSMYGNFEEAELPEDIDDESQYVTVPHKNELNLGRDLVFEFVERERTADHRRRAGRISATWRQREVQGHTGSKRHVAALVRLRSCSDAIGTGALGARK